MKSPAVISIISLLLPCSIGARDLDAQKTAKPRKRPNPAFAEVKDNPNLPRVLLIGDSISIGYTVPTRALLKGKANVHRIPENGGPTSRGVANLAKWLGSGKWHLIHFNWGLHDLKRMPDGKHQVPLDRYETNLRALVERLKATGARLVWASTTPVPAAKIKSTRANADVIAYNAAAKRIMDAAGIAIDDLYALALPRLAEIQRPDNVHFTQEGSAALAEQVAASILAAMGGPASAAPKAAKAGEVDTTSRRVRLVGLHPAVRKGIDLICHDDKVRITAGQAVIADRRWKTAGGAVDVAPADVVEVQRPSMTIVGGDVKSWYGGNRLIISPNDPRNLLPASFVPGSLRIHDPARPDVRFDAPRDYVVDETWGAFSVPTNSRLKPDGVVTAQYRMSLRRIDALILDGDGTPRLLRGTPAPDCPEPPAPPADALHLANIYRPFNASRLEPHHLYVCAAVPAQPGPIRNANGLAPVLAGLRAGRPVTVVCWGDSVTVGGDAGTPAHAYVGLFETMLKDRFPTADVRVINAGIGGSNTRGRLPGFRKEVLDHHPDLVTLEFVNDMGFSADELQQRYADILQRVRDAGAALILITPHFTMAQWMGLPHGRGPDGRPAVAFLRRFARQHGVPLADASRRWEQLEALGIPYETLLKNGINHPDDRGHRFFAEELMRFFPKD